ncbi:MAG: N-acetylneuraminate synthase family protein [Desulfobacterales bacterium]|jgi:sialic acid synthase SpsE/CMP-N-acetylneuraminic acid synthetase
MSYKRNNIWAIIPARGGSKGIPRKNIVDVAGKPLVAYTIEQGLASKYIDGVFVSTDDAEIKNVAKAYGASIIDRPANLSADESPTLEALRHGISWLKKEKNISADNIILLQATTPLRRVEDIDGAIALFFDENAHAVVSGVYAPHSFNPFWAKKITGGRLHLMFDSDKIATRRQDLPQVFWHNGQIYIAGKELILSHGDWYKGNCLPYICPDETFVNIDNQQDLMLAERLILEQRHQKVNRITLNAGGKKIGYGEPCFIVAEAGVNHNGDMDLAMRLVDVAAEAGVDAVKFQFFDPPNVTTSETGLAKYQREQLGNSENQIEMLKKLALTESEIARLKTHAEEKGLIFMCTSHSGVNEYKILDRMGVVAHKVGSGDLLNLPVLKYLAGTGKPIILGTGMATLDEVKAAYRFFVREGCQQTIFLHCTTEYPCPFDRINMNALTRMIKELDCPVGYSDHSLGTEAPIMAVTLGACVLEKHFTIDRTLPGPDHEASILPDELERMVRQIRNVEAARGTSEKMPTASENDTAGVARKSIVYARDLPKGSVLGEGDITVKRPGTGMSPLLFFEVIGKKTKRRAFKDQLVNPEDFVK